MPNPLVCPSCDCKIKAKEEQAGRKIKCPRCGNVIAVPKPEAAEEIEMEEVEEAGITLPKPPTVRAAGDAASRNKSRRDSDDDDEVPSVKKKESVLQRDVSKDINELNHSFNNFDVSRFTLVGWLAFVVAVALAMGAVALVDLNYETIMDIPRDQRIYIKHYTAHGIAAAVVGLGCFFGALGGLKLAGIKLIKPKRETQE